jgi:hypothetical protein
MRGRVLHRRTTTETSQDAGAAKNAKDVARQSAAKQ